MSIKYPGLLLLFLITGACNNDGQSTTEIKNDSIASKLTAVDSVFSGCYAQIIERDTSLLQFSTKNNTINGTLSYNLYEKDRNDGTLQGEVAGDTIKGWYLFKSEGIISVRQVAWKVNGDELWPATGDIIQKNDTALFAQPDKLQFDNTRPFKKIPCII